MVEVITDLPKCDFAGARFPAEGKGKERKEEGGEKEEEGGREKKKKKKEKGRGKKKRRGGKKKRKRGKEKEDRLSFSSPKRLACRPPRAGASGTMLLHNFFGGALWEDPKEVRQQHCAEAKKARRLKINLHFWPSGPNQSKTKIDENSVAYASTFSKIFEKIVF